MTPKVAAERALARLLEALPPRAGGWSVEPTIKADTAVLTSTAENGQVRLEVDAARRVVRLVFTIREAGVLRPVRIAVGPVAGGRGWPERLASAAASFVAGDPQPGVPHRRGPLPPELAIFSVPWTCPSCSSETRTNLRDLLGLSGAMRCGACRRPAQVTIEARAVAVRLRVVEAGG